MTLDPADSVRTSAEEFSRDDGMKFVPSYLQSQKRRFLVTNSGTRGPRWLFQRLISIQPPRPTLDIGPTVSHAEIHGNSSPKQIREPEGEKDIQPPVAASVKESWTGTYGWQAPSRQLYSRHRLVMHRYPRPCAADFFDLSRPHEPRRWTHESHSSDAVTESIYQLTHSEFQCPKLHRFLLYSFSSRRIRTPLRRYAAHRTPAIFIYFGVPQTTPFECILLAQGVLACLGLGVAYVPNVAVVSHYFHRRRSLMMALVQSGTPLGAIVHPILLNNTLHNSRIGFRNAVRISAGINSALLLLASILHQEITQMVSFCATMKRVHRDRAYVLATIGMTAFVIAFWYPIFFLQLDAVTHGVGHTFAFYVLVIMNASGLVGRVVWGFLAEIFGVANVVTATAGCGTALVLGIILRTIASVVVLAILNGFVAGVYAALLPPHLASLTEDFAEVGWYDTAHGLSFTIEGFGGLIGSPICGALLTAHFIWWRPALYSGGMGLLGFALFLAAGFIVRRKESKGIHGRTSCALGTAQTCPTGSAK
ncbi:major facilitator superfamily domain-containing protein [Mycena rebaudengoi]|nr:major facilitator superfamily domain-containing protein [Mycena rebaudengoi]